ncbi:MAG TPA: metalloregulator ArsR/SmtB family transcription factor [Spirochaetia bacterium]|nr:metalloregulator ArsR/SmtB family transcription factor [Spirochaetia bacterium]HTO20994.1 metalloregulator ArsR/SmtB family transcription factor [Spirochaetia bacterium]HTZ50350.1 metalloregulator ArsR/SmtB family transcription factor [Spirochaetia bacterium]
MGSLAEARPRAAHLADVLKALAHPERLRIVAALSEEEQTVTDLAARLGLPQAVVSQQLRILRMSGLAAVERLGGFARYRLGEPRLRDLLACLEGCHSDAAGASGARSANGESGPGKARGRRS